MKKFVAGYFVFLLALGFLLFGGRLSPLTSVFSKPILFRALSGLSYSARVQGKEFQIYSQKEGWQPFFVAGVNMGLGKPGAFPGECAITKEEYLRWFGQISDMNANTIRVYTAQMPIFYEALAQHNATAQRPLYLIQGVYVNEEDMLQYSDVFAGGEKIKTDFIADALALSDILHGNAVVAERAGHAWGTYTADVSQYVTGWILGVEWEPQMVIDTNMANPEKTAYQGEYIYTRDASPFEVFLAESADALLRHEAERYGTQHPIAFSNWVTTDPLTHPDEPNEGEDLVSVDGEHILATEQFEAGFFASYHIYPYYPESLNYQREYVETGNPYRAYLDELNAHHTMPVLVAEVGIPASRGKTHENPISGYHQGHTDEKRQGEILAELVGDIHNAGYMGALLFSWQDEWFKRTWNTFELDAAERRPYWIDYQTCEQLFGLLAFDPGETATAAVVDGKTAEWEQETPILSTGGTTLYAKSDEGYLYLRVDTDSFGQEPIYIGIDTIRNQGISTYEGRELGCEADFLLILDGKENSRLLVDSYYDPTYYAYGVKGTQFPREYDRERKDFGQFVPATQLLRREIRLPRSGTVYPVSTFDAGHLTYGVADPASPEYSSLADFCVGEESVELRLPYLLLNISDPSTGLILDDFYARDGFATIQGDGLTFGLGKSAGTYHWDYWGNEPTYHERLKPTYFIIQDYFATLPQAEAPAQSAFGLFWNRWSQPQVSSAAPWFPIQPTLNYLIVLLTSLAVYFFLALLLVHVHAIVLTRRSQTLKTGILALDRRSDYLTRRQGGLSAVSQLLRELPEGDALRLSAFLVEMDYVLYLRRHLSDKKGSSAILAANVAGKCGMTVLAPDLEAMLRRRTTLDAQYHGFLALALLGAEEQLVTLLTEPTVPHTLSYRSMLEIFNAYTGEKVSFYRALLSSPDAYIVRLCMKQIGLDGVKSLAPALMPWLESQEFSTRLDAVRSLGQLGYAPAAPHILSLLKNERWELRSVAVTALASIDLYAYTGKLEQMLRDKEWQVRHNAAAALCTLPWRKEILRRAEASGDRYAAEILAYMIDTQGGKEVAAACSTQSY